MPSKPTELLPPCAPPAALDLLALAQWNGAAFDSRKMTLQQIADFAAAAGIPLIGVDTVAATAYTFLGTDNYRHKRFTAATTVTATVPLNASHAIAIGTRIRGTAAGAGQVILTPESAGVALRSRAGALKSAGQYAVFEIEKVGTDEWDVLGDVTV